jgi:arsenate reductase (thioredoxin)
MASTKTYHAAARRIADADQGALSLSFWRYIFRLIKVLMIKCGFTMSKNYNVLFLCTGNSARSILAEAVLNSVGSPRFKAWSAGSQPKGKVHPSSLELLSNLSHDVSKLRSKSWDEFANEDAPVFDFIFTVCDNAAGEACPIWLGHPTSAHWGIPDPAAFEGSDDEIDEEFAIAYERMKRRITAFVALPFDDLEPGELTAALQDIGSIED